jgi:predicted enzyme related to lactoylglutathione lyase
MSKKVAAKTKSKKASKPAVPAKRAAPARKPVKAKAKAKPARPMFEKVAFTMFGVEDAMRARAFYEDVLGLTRGLASPEGTWTEYDLPGGGCLALFRHPNPDFARPPGGAAVALEVADLDGLNTRLVAAGVVYQGGMIHGPHCRMSNILDSEGNAIILHELAGKR